LRRRCFALTRTELFTLPDSEFYAEEFKLCLTEPRASAAAWFWELTEIELSLLSATCPLAGEPNTVLDFSLMINWFVLPLA